MYTLYRKQFYNFQCFSVWENLTKLFSINIAISVFYLYSDVLLKVLPRQDAEQDCFEFDPLIEFKLFTLALNARLRDDDRQIKLRYLNLNCMQSLIVKRSSIYEYIRSLYHYILKLRNNVFLEYFIREYGINMYLFFSLHFKTLIIFIYFNIL